MFPDRLEKKNKSFKANAMRSTLNGSAGTTEWKALRVISKMKNRRDSG